VTLTRDIVMPHDTWHCNATWHWQCHVSHTGTWHVAFFLYFFFKKNKKKNLKNFKKKIKKI